MSKINIRSVFPAEKIGVPTKSSFLVMEKWGTKIGPRKEIGQNYTGREVARA